MHPLARTCMAVALVASWGVGQRPAPADLVLTNGKIVTVDPELGVAKGIAVRGDRIVAVGTIREIQKHVGNTTKFIDLEGKLVIPGFIEGHAHFVGIGNAKQILDLTKVTSWDDVVDMVAAAVRQAKPGEWIRGRGWHQEKWSKTPQNAVGGFPTHGSLSAVSPDNPVGLTHASGHAAFYNAKAMQLAGISKSTPNPSGGEILRDGSGNAIGVFSETAQGLVGRTRILGGLRRTRAERHAALEWSIELADRECLENGITSFQDAGSTLATVTVLKGMAARGKLGTRLWVMLRDGNGRLARGLADVRLIGFGNNHLTVRAIKRTIDGALGSRGAWLLEPYSDSPKSSGLNTASVESVTRTAQLAAQHGYQFCVHAIGDKANRVALDIFEAAFKDLAELAKARWRIEHAQHIHPVDIPRFGKLGVIASMQGVHCTSDGPWVVPRLGEQRAETGAYVWRSLLESGAIVTNGTDAPVEDIDPIASYYASVSRRMKNGKVFFAAQRMTRMEALASYTISCAKAAFEEDIKGTLTPGKLADMVVLSKDILTIPEAEILDTVVLYTIVGGKVLYKKAN